MEEEKKNRFMTQAINDEILEKLSLKNRYSFLNANLTAILEPKEFNFLKSHSIMAAGGINTNIFSIHVAPVIP